MKSILQQLFQGAQLTRDQAKTYLMNIAHEKYNIVQTTAFVTAYNMRPIQPEELSGFRDALLELAIPLSVSEFETIDIVGTGGDGKNSFNISTLAAIVVAGAGYKVTKHGSYGVSSHAGSSDVLQALGYSFTADTDSLRRQLDEYNICFLHAPLFHPAMKAVVPIRKQLGMRSFFNMLGPLVNPARPKYHLLGTFDIALSRLYQYILQKESGRFSIVHSLDGYDEVSLTSPVKLRRQSDETILQPEDFGLKYTTQKDLYGGRNPQEAASIFLRVLQNTCTPAQRDVVLANAGLAIHTIHPEKILTDCVEEARESLLSGNALKTLKSITV